MSSNFRAPSWAFLVVVLLHAWFSMWAFLYNYFGDSYLFSNFGLMMLGFAALIFESSFKIVALYEIVMLFTILNDALTIGWFTTRDMLNNVGGQTGDQIRFSFAFSIINIVFKPLFLWVAYCEFSNRGGTWARLLDSVNGKSSPYSAVPANAPPSNFAAASTMNKQPEYRSDGTYNPNVYNYAFNEPKNDDMKVHEPINTSQSGGVPVTSSQPSTMLPSTGVETARPGV